MESVSNQKSLCCVFGHSQLSLKSLDGLRNILFASSGTVPENWKQIQSALLFVTHLNKMPGSPMSEKKVVLEFYL